MNLRLLVVEGNTEHGSARIAECGGKPYAQGYSAVLKDLRDDIECTAVFPSEDGANSLPPGVTFDDFEGAVWTGSALNAYDDVPPVLNQLRFAENLFASGTPIFGSCWGLQIVTRALGGRVRKNPKGREIGIATDICLNAEGRAHPMFEDKAFCFDGFAVHTDEIEDPAPGSRILASNTMSAIQALSIESGGRFWGVQYHPEFDAHDVAIIYKRLAPDIVREGLFTDLDAVTIAARNLQVGEQAFDRLELKNWLKTLGA
ncbi:type 1 glutamine amidotransferase [bacterium AH-315-P15]|nr:type 1 glutamine amidotransferase [bacterium AH-315-P15]